MGKDGNQADVSALSQLIKSGLITVPGVVVVEQKSPRQSAIHLVCSLQRSGRHVRLTWGIFEKNDTVQASGGEVTGDFADIKSLERRFIDDITSQLRFNFS